MTKYKKKKFLLYVLFIIAGSVAGYAYWYFIGCNSGTCPITSKWHNTTIYGGVIGYLFGGMLMDVIYKKSNIEKEKIV